MGCTGWKTNMGRARDEGAGLEWGSSAREQVEVLFLFSSFLFLF
jgi:hypothetical protein